MKKFVHIISGWSWIGCLFYLIGLAGSSDCELVIWSIMLPKILIVSLIMTIMFIIWKLTENKRKRVIN